MLLYQDLSDRIINGFYKVHEALGPGLLEAPYHNALYYCLKKMGLDVEYQFPLPVYFEGEQVGEYYADLLIERKIIVEVKSVHAFSGVHTAQLLNYLRIAGCRVGFLANFNLERCGFKRLVLWAGFFYSATDGHGSIDDAGYLVIGLQNM